jgi:class 3 adenylate cyclase
MNLSVIYSFIFLTVCFLFFRSDFIIMLKMSQEEAKSKAMLENMLPSCITNQLQNNVSFLCCFSLHSGLACLAPGQPSLFLQHSFFLFTPHKTHPFAWFFQALVAHNISKADVLFSDIVSFTTICSRLQPEDVVAMLNVIFSCFDALTTAYGVYKVETIGDAYVACANVVANSNKHSLELVACALAFQENTEFFFTPDNQRINIRIGIHTGPTIAGVVGRKMPRYHLFGETLTIAEDAEAKGVAAKVSITHSTRQSLLQLQFENYFSYEPHDDLKLADGRTLSTYLVSKSASFVDPLRNEEADTTAKSANSLVETIAVNQKKNSDSLSGPPTVGILVRTASTHGLIATEVDDVADNEAARQDADPDYMSSVVVVQHR